MPDFITINNHRIGQGEQQKIQLNIARLPTYTSIDLPVHVYRGEQDGPVLLLTGGMHGDEINGVEIIRRMIYGNRLQPGRGTVIAIPLVNVYGFIQNVRGVPDGKDINRSFPGTKGGSLAKLVAYTLMNEIVPQIDYGIDFHTGGGSRANFPQVRCNLDLKINVKLARAFSPPVIIHSSPIEKSFRKAAQKKEKHIIVYETGETHRFDDAGIEEGVNGTLRLMHSLDMIPGAPGGGEPQIYRKSTWIRAGFAGLFRPSVQLGDEIDKKQVLGHITDPFGNERFKSVSRRAGKVIGLNNAPVVHKGDALMHIAHNPND